MNQREESVKQWTGHSSINSINAGSLQRIADACETMAKDRDRLIADRDWYKNRWESEQRGAQRLARSNAALRGYIKRLKST